MIKMSFFKSPKIRISFQKGLTHDYGKKFLIFFEPILLFRRKDLGFVVW